MEQLEEEVPVLSARANEANQAIAAPVVPIPTAPAPTPALAPPAPTSDATMEELLRRIESRIGGGSGRGRGRGSGSGRGGSTQRGRNDLPNQ